MTELNILRERVRYVRERALFFRALTIYFIIFAVILFGMGITAFVNVTLLRRAQQDTARLAAEIQSERTAVASLKRYQEETRELRRDIAFWRKEMGQRVVWARKLAFIGESVPPGVWLKKISLAPGTAPGVDRRSDLFLVEALIDPAIINERRAVSELRSNLENRVSGEFREIRLKEVRRTVIDQREVVLITLACSLEGEKQ